MTDTPSAVPGWYPDPTGAAQSRWWDGSQWTSATQPAAQSSVGVDDAAATGPNSNRNVALAVGAAVLVVVLAFIAGAQLLGDDESDQLATADASVGPEEPAATSEGLPEEVVEEPSAQPAPAAGCDFRDSGRPPARPVQPPGEDDVATSGSYTFTMDTSVGTISFATDAASTPCTVGSFRNLAAQEYFDGTSCHRLTTEGIFVLQCGDPTGTGSGGPGYEYDDEALEGASYPAGTVAMANAGPGTNGSQFFLVYEDSQLPPSYTPLGQITEGLEAVREVAQAGVEGGGGDGRPATPVDIRTFRVS